MKRPPFAWIVLGLLLGIAGAYALFVREPSTVLTEPDLAAARTRWADRAPLDYDLVVETSGSMEAEHRIEVRGGEVRRMLTGEREASRSAWEYWSIEGLFGFLSTELDNAANCEAAYGVPPGGVVLRIRFHDTLGYPEYFMRHVMGKGMGVEWRVVKLEPTAS